MLAVSRVRPDPAVQPATQVDDGYPSDRILLKEALGVITYLSDSRLVKNQPCPDLPTPGGLEHRRKLSDKVYQFEYGAGCNGAPGDLFVVRLLLHCASMSLACSLCSGLEHVWLPGALCPFQSTASARNGVGGCLPGGVSLDPGVLSLDKRLRLSVHALRHLSCQLALRPWCSLLQVG